MRVIGAPRNFNSHRKTVVSQFLNRQEGPKNMSVPRYKLQYTKNSKHQKSSKSRYEDNHHRHKRSPTPIRAYGYPEQTSPTLMSTDEYEDDSSPVRQSTTPVFDANVYSFDEDWDISETVPLSNYAMALVTSTKTDNDQGDEPLVVGALQNIGNSCYMNAVLYTLRFTPNFTHFIHHLMQNLGIIANDVYLNTEEMCEQHNATVKLCTDIYKWGETYFRGDALHSSDYKVIVALHETFSQLTTAEMDTRQPAIRPRMLQRAVCRVDNIFAPGTQQDSHEFLLCVLNSIRDCSDLVLKLAESKPEIFVE